MSRNDGFLFVSGVTDRKGNILVEEGQLSYKFNKNKQPPKKTPDEIVEEFLNMFD